MVRKLGLFHEKLILITGGSNGIGAALATLFSQEGANVWLLARREIYLEKSLGKVINSSNRSGQRHGYVTCDVSNLEDVGMAIDRVINDIGIPDVVVNCAGVVHPGEYLDLDLDKFNWMMDINYFGTVHVIRKVLPGMLHRGTGHIVNISSAAALFGLYGYTAYAPSKSAVYSLSQALRLELKPKGIAVTVVLPTDTDTDQLQYEEKYRPPETRAIAALGFIHSSESVAREILNGIVRKKFLILPGIDAKFFYWVVKILGNTVLMPLDWLIRRTQSKIE